MTIGVSVTKKQVATIQQGTCVLLGDSITNQCANEVTFNNDTAGYIHWANALMNTKLNILKVLGYSGQTTSVIMTHIDEAISYQPKFIFILAGVNDIGSSVSTSTTTANLTYMYDKCKSAGIIVVACTVPPRNITTYNSYIYAVNEWIRKQQYIRSDFIVCDFYNALVEPSTDIAKANFTTDGVHPSVFGAYFMGKEVATKLNPHIATPMIFSGSNGDLVNMVVPNSHLLGGATVATGWTGTINTGTGTFSKIARANSLEWQQCNMTVLGDFLYYQSIYSNWAVGDKVKLVWEYEVDAGASIDRFGTSLEIRSGAGVIGYSNGLFISSGATIRFYNEATSGVIETPWVTIPAGAVRIIPYFQAKLTGSIRFGRCRVIKYV